MTVIEGTGEATADVLGHKFGEEALLIIYVDL